VLYAGLEQGVWVSLDRGVRWESLRLNMPSVAVHDLRIQPAQHDVLAATHGRGFWILDDVTALSGLRQAVDSAAPAFFPARPAYTWYRWWTSYYGTQPDECCLAPGMYAGEDPPEGASLTYYLPASRRTWLEVLDAGGRRVRCFNAPGEAGVQRTSWDLTETPPVQWLRAREWNRGSAGATVIPGTYLVRLHAGNAILERRLDVRPDPRASWETFQYIARYRFLSELNGELSQIDTALNRLDSMSAVPPFPSTKPVPSRAEGLRAAWLRVTQRRQFTSGVVNAEDDQLMPDRLRERLTILQGGVALSQGPPTPAQLREAAAIKVQFDAAMAAYTAFLTAHHLPPDPKPQGCI
jgi:hypothetical protein